MNTEKQPNHQEMFVAFDEWQKTRGQSTPSVHRRNWLQWLLPTPGNIIFTLLLISTILWAQNAGAIPRGATNVPTETNMLIPYQGRLTDADGKLLSGEKSMAFSLYTEESGGEPLWSEPRYNNNRVEIVNGLFNVMLGSVEPLSQSVITENSTLYLGITVDLDNDEMVPRVQLGRVPYAVQALTVPDGSITTEKLASNLIEHYATTVSETYWDVPNTSCGLGTGYNAENYITIPDLSLDFTLDKPKTVWLDFTALGGNAGAGQALYSSFFIDGVAMKFPSGSGLHLSGCRNSPQDTSGHPRCSLANTASTILDAGDHTVDVRVWCDGSDSLLARVYGGTLRALILP